MLRGLSAWYLVFVPFTPLLIFGVLWLSVVVEQRVLSPRALVARAVRSRRSSPEQAEALVAAQLRKLLDER